MNGQIKAYLILEDESVFEGFFFGAKKESAGEVVFNTGMVGYPESFTDPSYRGQILVLTYPLIGNYGVPASIGADLSRNYESDRIHLSGLIVSEYSNYHHHWAAERGLSSLLEEQGISGIEGVDTRALTKKLRKHGTMRGFISEKQSVDKLAEKFAPRHVVGEVSIVESKIYKSETYGFKSKGKRVAVVDCGCKNTIIRSLLARGANVIRVPWNTKVDSLDIDGVLFSNGPGDPQDCEETINTAARVIEKGIPAFGICLGSQILALASGAKTYKLKFGHRGQNQPCRDVNGKRFFITSQNHGYAVESSSLPEGWETWFENVNDGTNEGVRHASKPIMGVQFHPEAMPGPADTGFLFDEFIAML